ncbi:MAG: MBL fold metallo-hydrolase [bacterium]|nr:MBL fold metallo-hydrolase [bacterium]
MKLHFLGGANEVGASCTLIEIEGRRILVDSGIRMGAAQGSQLPNFSVLDDVGPPEEVLVTHAHTDHTGALPVVFGALPTEVKIRCTPPTQAITRVLLSDAVKLMQRRGEQDGELLLYPPDAADACLGRMAHVPYLTTVPICGGDLSATWIPAGHILGAASIYIEGRRESVLMTGDVSVANQQTIAGMVIPRCRPDVMVMESTYGNRQHADRAQQETSLALRVAEVIEEGGKVLIPAFAVGRSQEVILILKEAMRKGQIPEFPVFVDGMVRAVNAVYAAFVDDLAPPLRRRVLKGEDPFYSEWVGAVSVPADRDRVLAGPPCCIVASSGMLIGGASSYYAERLANDPANLIAITGYQDEESPGRALLDLVAEKEVEKRMLMLNGQRVSVRCRVETYSLSAHADGGELAGLVRRLSPRTVYLVHGDEEARKALASELDLHLSEGVFLPENGGAYTVEAEGTRARRYGRAVIQGGIAGGRELDEKALEEVRAYLIETRAKGVFRVQELAEVWFGTDGLGLEQVESFRGRLTESVWFEPDRRRPYLYHIREEAAVSVDGPMEMNEARERILATFPPEAGLFKCSAHVDEGVYELAFHFPDVVPERYGEQLEALEEETGWTLRLRETPHQSRLFEEALAVLPETVPSLKAPALRLDRKEVVITVSVPPELLGDWDTVSGEAGKRFVEITGFTLVWDGSGVPASKWEGPAPTKDAWEINRAYGEIRQVFQKEAHAPYKIGLKNGAYIEAAFISLMVGERYRALLDELGDRIGWDIQVRETANQEQIAQEARQITPQSCTVRGAARIYPGENRVVVPVVELPGEADVLQDMFRDRTGFEIDWEIQ